MNIVVCVKQILDPEMPAEKFRIKANRVVPPEGVDLVLNPCDAQAVEASLRFKEKYGAGITAVSVGSETALEVVRRSLAMGADEGVLISDGVLEGSDSAAVAYILTQAIKKLANVDLVLCGREAADWNMGIVGPFLAEGLGWPLITWVKEIDLQDNTILRVERVIPDGKQVFEVSLPAVMSVSHEIGLARLPTGMGIVMAMRRQIPTWTHQDLGVDTALSGKNAAGSALTGLALPDRDRKCEFIQGETPEEIADNLAPKLQAAGML